MRGHRLLFAVLVAAALLRAAWSASVSPAAFLEIDGIDYRDIAQNLSAGRGYAISAPRWFEPGALLPPGLHADFARPPLVPVLGSVLFRLPGAWETWARSVMVALGTMAVWLAFRAGAAIFNRRTGIIAAVILALHPFAVFYSGRWSTETPFLVAVLGAVVTLAPWGVRDRGTRREDLARPALAGVLTGLAALTRPTGLLLIPAIAAWIALRRGRHTDDDTSVAARPTTAPGGDGVSTAAPDPVPNAIHSPTAVRNALRHPTVGSAAALRTAVHRSAVPRAAVFLAFVTLTLAPWAVRNHTATGRWNPGTFFGPYNLWAGMNDRILAMHHGAGTPRYTAEVEALFHEDSRAMVSRMEARGIAGPVAEGSYWSDAAREWVRAHPGRAAEILARRVAHYFQVTPEATVMSKSARAAALYLWPVHLLSLAALWWHRRRVPWLLLVPPAVGLLASLPFVFSLRFRFPFLDPYAVLFAAAALGEIPGRMRRRDRRPDRQGGRRRVPSPLVDP